MYSPVKVWKETLSLPTWTTGQEDPNPMFLENRVYQGSSGAVYPWGVIDTLTGEREMREYQGVWLENDFIRILLLPELGGRIHRAWDKVRERDFVYYNEVVKPALVGLVGPWISGGIEFNWPQHHRPTTFMPVDMQIQQAEDGSATVWLGELEPMRGLQAMTGFKLYPEKALVEITGKVFNPNSTPRHFLWWANPAVKGGDEHQSVFPPDVTAVFDHGKRDVSAFPIARGTYYKVDYSAGVDISRYKNIPVPTSYMAEKSDYDFVGAYHHGEQGGLLHVADHHVSPGKKQWSWGSGDFGLAWDRNLTDENGPYIELMTGVFTDNQPDFTWIAPLEEKVFVQNFMPYSYLGTVQNASTEAVLKLERDGDELVLGVYAVSPLEGVNVVLTNSEGECLRLGLDLAPGMTWIKRIATPGAARLTMSVVEASGRTVLEYLEHIPSPVPLPQPATAPELPQALSNTDELFYIGQHLEQYHHASRFARDYYQRALEIDSGDYRNNVAAGQLAWNRADWQAASDHARAALARATRLNKNPQNGDASLLLAGALERQGDDTAAWDHFYKATWSGSGKDAAFWGLARLAMKRGDAHQALTMANQSLCFNQANNLAMGLKALALWQTGGVHQARRWVDECLAQWPLSYVLHYARWQIEGSDSALQRLLEVTGRRGTNASVLAGWLVSFGAEQQAAELLALIDSPEALPRLWQASLTQDAGQQENFVAQAQAGFSIKVRFPNTLDEVVMLQGLADHPFARYLLGCFWYSKRRYQDAVACWQFTVAAQPGFAPAWRLLGIHAWNKNHDQQQAREWLQKAVDLEPDNARFLFELDCLDKLTAQPTAARLDRLSTRLEVVQARDDLTAELLSLWHIHGENQQAAQLLASRQFHPWEGGEGKITGQYLINQQRRALAAIGESDFTHAQKLLQDGLNYPLNLGEGRLPGQKDNDLWFLLGWCARQQGDSAAAERCFEQACSGEGGLAASRYYNDQPVDYLFWQGMALAALGKQEQARQHFNGFIEWSNSQADNPPQADFFAVSLPDLLALDGNPLARHRQHCLFVQALGYLGLGQGDVATGHLDALLTENPAHDKARLIQHIHSLGIIG